MMQAARDRLGQDAKLGKQYDYDEIDGTLKGISWFVWSCAFVDGVPHADEALAFRLACKKADKSEMPVKFEYFDGAKAVIENDHCVSMDIRRAPDIALANRHKRLQNLQPSQFEPIAQPVISFVAPAIPELPTLTREISKRTIRAIVKLVMRKSGATRAEILAVVSKAGEQLPARFNVTKFLREHQTALGYRVKPTKAGRYYVTARATRAKPVSTRQLREAAHA
jgi:hypothetical protein